MRDKIEGVDGNYIPEIEAHSPEEFKNDMFMWESVANSSVFPDSVLVWKRRVVPPFSYF